MNGDNDPNRPDQDQPDPYDEAAEFWHRVRVYIASPEHAGVITAVATVLIFLSGLFYVLFSWLLWDANKKAADAALIAANAAREQAKLTSEESEGIQAALLKVNGPVSFTNPMTELSEGQMANNIVVSIGFRNEGKVIGTNVRTTLKMQVLNLSRQQMIGKQWTCERVIPFIRPDPGTDPRTIICPIEGLSDEELRLVEALKYTVAIDGQTTYEDGFTNDKGLPNIRTIPLCFRFLPKIKTGEQWGFEGSDHFEPCEDFIILRQRMTAHMGNAQQAPK